MSAPMPPGRLKRGQASLIGGLLTGAAVFALALALARALGWAGAGAVLLALLAGAAVAVWVRMADL